ncbi:MAG: ABC transporter substrate-binding protein [Deferrisomatales bacterium]
MKGLGRVRAIALAAALLWGPVAFGAGPGGPRQVVEELHATLLQVMRAARELGYEGRLRRLDPVVRRAFDFPAIARLAIGHHRRELSERELEEWVETFARFSVALYAARFDGYSGERFEVLSLEDLSRGRALVRTRLLRPGRDPVHLDYVLRPAEGGWKIVNVVAEGVSDLSLKRAEYTSILEKEGFRGLLERVREKTRELGS